MEGTSSCSNSSVSSEMESSWQTTAARRSNWRCLRTTSSVSGDATSFAKACYESQDHKLILQDFGFFRTTEHKCACVRIAMACCESLLFPSFVPTPTPISKKPTPHLAMGSAASPPPTLDASASPKPPPAAVVAAAAAAAALLTQEDLKRVAAHLAVEMVEPGMTLGLGTGSTAAHALDRLGDLLRGGALRGVAGVPTSLKTEAHAARVGIPLLPLGVDAEIHLSIDGADEVDPELNLVKGRGGSLLREKMIEGAGDRFVVIVDESKLVPRLGCTGAVPVEVVPFGCAHTLGLIRKVFDKLPGFHARLRTARPKDGSEQEVPFVTDNGNYIVEMFFEDGIHGDLREVSDRLLRITGVVEHGMFLGMATSVIVAKKDGTVAVLNKK